MIAGAAIGRPLLQRRIPQADEQCSPLQNVCKRRKTMKATGIVRRVDDLGRIVIPEEIRRTLRFGEGDPLRTILTPITDFVWRYIVWCKEQKRGEFHLAVHLCTIVL